MLCFFPFLKSKHDRALHSSCSRDSGSNSEGFGENRFLTLASQPLSITPLPKSINKTKKDGFSSNYLSEWTLCYDLNYDLLVQEKEKL